MKIPVPFMTPLPPENATTTSSPQSPVMVIRAGRGKFGKAQKGRVIVPFDMILHSIQTQSRTSNGVTDVYGILRTLTVDGSEDLLDAEVPRDPRVAPFVMMDMFDVENPCPRRLKGCPRKLTKGQIVEVSAAALSFGEEDLYAAIALICETSISAPSLNEKKEIKDPSRRGQGQQNQ